MWRFLDGQMSLSEAISKQLEHVTRNKLTTRKTVKKDYQRP